MSFEISIIDTFSWDQRSIFIFSFGKNLIGFFFHSTYYFKKVELNTDITVFWKLAHVSVTD